MCLFYVRVWCGAPGGFPTATAGWIGARYKHAGDLNPPAGVPVWWSGGAGHVALSIGSGKIISTDWPHTGIVGQTTIAEMNRRWHKTYKGWSEDIDGARISGIGSSSPVTQAPSTTPVDNAQPTGFSLGGIFATVAEWQHISDWLSDAHNWIRVGLFIVGLMFCIIGMVRIMREPVKSATSAVKKVGEYASLAKA